MKTVERADIRARMALAFALVLCASGVFTLQAGEENERVLADLSQGMGVFTQSPPGIETVTIDGTAVKGAKITDAGQLKSEQPGSDWAQYTHLKVAVVNLNAGPVRMHLMLKDDSAPHGYFSWCNRYVMVAPGSQQIEFQIAALKRGEGSPKDSLDPRPLNWDKLQFALIGGDKQPLYVTRVWLAKETVKTFATLKAFDFGPKQGSVGFMGFTEVTPEAAYKAETGYGFVNGAPPYARHRAHPADELVGDWISGENFTFRVDLPNGEYAGFVLMEDPGEWELYQNFTHRSLSVNGKPVVDEKQSGAEFLDRYFHFAQTEDRPGDDIWARYVAWRYPLRPIAFTVTEGKAEFNLRSNGQYAGTWNALAVWPAAEAEKAKGFLADLEQRRRKSMAGSWTEKLPAKQTAAAAPTATETAAGYRLFQRPLSVDVNYYDQPQAGEALPERLEYFAARGERVPIQFALAAIEDLKGLTLTAGEFKSTAGQTLPATAVQCGFVSWKFKRLGFGGQGQYGVVPFVIQPFGPSAPSTAAAAGSARQFWTTIAVPVDQPAGDYTGTLTLTGEGLAERTIPVTVQVVGVVLPEADAALGFYGYSTAPWSAYQFAENQARLTADRQRMLADLRAHGVTLFTVDGVKLASCANGQAAWDVSAAAKAYGEARAAGFTQIQVHADDNRMLNEIAFDPAAAAGKYGFADGSAILAATYGTVNAACEKAGLPKPLFSFGDEPATQPVMDKLTVMYGNIRKVGAVGTIAYSTSHAITQPLLAQLGLSSLNHATLADIQAAKAAGNRVMFNNQGRNRWAFGVYLWKWHTAGVEGVQQFIYNGPHVDPFNPFDGVEDDESMVYPDRAGNLRARVDYERIAAGIGDYRWILLYKKTCEGMGVAGEKQWGFCRDLLAVEAFTDTMTARRAAWDDGKIQKLRERMAPTLLRAAGAKAD